MFDICNEIKVAMYICKDFKQIHSLKRCAITIFCFSVSMIITSEPTGDKWIEYYKLSS